MKPYLVITRESSSGSALAAMERGDLDGGKLQPLGENASIEDGSNEVVCQLVTEGPGNEKHRNWYTPEFIESAAQAYEGKRAYLNHQTDDERRTRSEGDIRELCGFYKDCQVKEVFIPDLGRKGPAVVGTLVLDESDAGRNAKAKAMAQLEYKKAFPMSDGEYCGLSINGTGMTKGTQEWNGAIWKKIVAVGEGDSVDVVTRPARGGAFQAIMESVQDVPAKNREHNMTRKQLILVAEAADLAERLGKATETSTREALQKQIVDVHVRLKEAMDEDPAKEMDPMKAKEMDPMKAKEMDPMKYKEMGDDAYKAKEMDDGAMGMIRKLVPKMTDESDDDYAGRVSKVQAACKEMEKPRAEGGMESLRESVSVDSFRKEYPRLFEAVVGRIRNHDDRGEKDFKALRAELQESQVKVQVYEDQKLATALLAESGLPKRVLDVSDLIGQTREEMIRTIDKTKAILESVGANNTVVVPVFGGGGGPGGSAGAGSAEIKLRESAKAFVKKAGE